MNSIKDWLTDNNNSKYFKMKNIKYKIYKMKLWRKNLN